MDNEVKVGFFKKHRLDIIVISLLLFISLTVLAVFLLTKEDGASVKVEVDGNVVGTYSLSVDGEYSLNGGTNILTVKDGVAYMTYSNCPDHTCENTGKVKHVGETIVCLPNRITVTVVGDVTSDDGYVDFIT